MILDGKKYRDEVEENLTNEVKAMKIKPTLAVILIGDNPASITYVNSKEKIGKRIGINILRYNLSKEITYDEVEALITNLNNNNKVDGIMLQHPIPNHLDENKIFNLIDCNKDVDGLSSLNLGLTANNNESLKSASPLAVIDLLKRNNITISGKHVVIVGRSRILGKPLSLMFLNENATVTTCHSYTNNLKDITKTADILVGALGKAHFIKEDMIKEGAVLIDCGYKDNKGDIDPSCYSKASAYTPVPGGIGPVTIIKLLEQVVKQAQKNSFK